MKVYIGPYLNWWGPYQIAELLEKVGVSGDKCRKIGKYLSETWVGTFLEWAHSKKKRKVKVKINYYDTFDLDSTLSYIIHPLLIKFKENKQSTPYILNSDIPKELHKADEVEYGNAEGVHNQEGYDWILNEMIWAFDPDWDDKNGFGDGDYTIDKYKENNKRQQNAFRLFGTHYSTLWS